ncbi:protein ALP1-like [Acyrthosiphon pisum]|uniref:DDE Tnp4 domain-containing protein n=1 Tax=Acyrthosiphon pisum TaxID=7029 RepID=A0A8R1W5G0_ACYPI|nr:protein ALP1-like [Acyrthosiphon pisum]|eukprot:XP_003244309.1 PREDICTED: putative nuclease HARBI1 [Acyrthosiphon pisum]
MSIDAIELALVEVINELITLKRKNQRSKKLWVRSWIERRNQLGISNTLLKELAVEDTSSYFNFLRINEEMFNVLLQKMAPKIQKQNTMMREALPAKLKLEVTLRYLATGDSYKTLQYIYRVGKSSISEFVPEVFNAILEELKEYIEVPREKSKWNKIMDGFNSLWNFPNCIGAIDGKHIVMECPANSGSNYFNYKGTFSIVLLALVDHNYNFTCIDIGSYGSNSDGGIFAKSALKKAIEEHVLHTPTDSVILGDDAFPLLPYLMKPYARRNHLTEREKVYNYRHCRARRIVENGFGILSSRFRVFRRPITLTPENTIQLVKAACALHNWIRKSGKNPNSISVDIEDTETGRLLNGSWRNDTSPTGLQHLGTILQRNSNTEAKDKRNSLADYFVEEGAVVWQNRMI